MSRVCHDGRGDEVVGVQDQQVVAVVDDALPSGGEFADNVNVRSWRTWGFYPSLAECDDLQQVRLFFFND